MHDPSRMEMWMRSWISLYRADGKGARIAPPRRGAPAAPDGWYGACEVQHLGLEVGKLLAEVLEAPPRVWSLVKCCLKQ